MLLKGATAVLFLTAHQASAVKTRAVTNSQNSINNEQLANAIRFAFLTQTRGGADPSDPESAVVFTEEDVINKHKLANAVGDPEDDSSGMDSDSDEPTDSEEDSYISSSNKLVGVDKESITGSEAVSEVILDIANGNAANSDTEGLTQYEVGNQAALIREALSEYIYLPPSLATRTLWANKQTATRFDVESKKKLDRRGLYRALLLEMSSDSASGTGGTKVTSDDHEEDTLLLHGPVNGRRYLSKETMYKLKSALSLASQPQWRRHTDSMKSSGRGVTFFDAPNVDADASDLATQSMQEVVTLALAHSYDCGFVIIDDKILSNIRNALDEDVRNADILRELFGLNKDTMVLPNRNPLSKIEEEADYLDADKLGESMVVFLRTESCANLFKSKTCCDVLQQACLNEDSTNLVVLGREPPFLTNADDKVAPVPSRKLTPQPQITNIAHPQAEVGKNDPEGSRRFNIFLVRLPSKETEDGEPSTAKIMGILAPAEVGNLFPQIMSNLTPENLNSMPKLALNNNATLTSATAEVDLTNRESQETSLSQGMQSVMDQLIGQVLNGAAAMSGDNNGKGVGGYVKDVLSNQVLRRGIADNLSRAAPALLDPRCCGVMLSVYIPPLSQVQGQGQLSEAPPNTPTISTQEQPNSQSKQNWLNKILSSHREEILMNNNNPINNASNANIKSNGQGQHTNSGMSKNLRHLQILQAQCSYIPLVSPTDPVRLKSWSNWIQREHSSLYRRRNKRALSSSLRAHKLKLSSMDEGLSQLLSTRDFTGNMDSIVQCAVEYEANESLCSHADVVNETSTILLIKPNSIINAIKQLYPQTAASSSSNHHQSKEDLMNMAADKHERALVNNIIFPEQIGISYEQIGGLDSVKDLLRQSITYPLRYPHLYSEGIAKESVKGVLLFGPPGTGKTMLAKAVATEGGATFLSVDPSSVENKWLGESEKNAKAVFTLARRLAPCVIFLDEVDSLLSSREHSDDSAHGTLTSVKTTMMSEWDGLNTNTAGTADENHRVVVIGSTNRPFDLDEAVLRRFPRRILVDLPDLQTRKEILEVTLNENRLDPQVNLTAIAERLEGYTGSDIKEVCREAVVQISHEQARLLDQGAVISNDANNLLRPVNMTDFEQALSKLKRSVSERGRELARVWEWNDQYGEIKKKDKKNPQLMNMFL